MFIVLGVLLLIASPVMCYLSSKYINNNENLKLFSIKEILKNKILLKNCIISISLTLLGLFVLCFSYIIKNKIDVSILNYLMIIIGSILISFLFTYLFLYSDILLYRSGINLPFKINKIAYLLLIVLLFLLSVLLFFEGISKYIIYPLYNLIHISGQGVELLRFNEYVEKGLKLTFYGVLILSGALTTYLICDYKFYRKYGKHGLLEDVLLVAFPSGLIGARLWYCLVLETEDFLADPIRILYVWDGGLAVMGGALLGTICGALYVYFKRKDLSLVFTFDTVVPCILVAQAIGRWGNFFNHEVYGNAVNAEAWNFLPTIIKNQMSTSFINGMPNGETIYLPLFLIESLINIAGYFVITELFGRLLKKYMKPGVKGFMYLIWYGMTRAILEPLRYGEFQYNNSWYTSFALIGVGLLIIIGIYVGNYIVNKKKKITNE